jgi:hypothetical protein
MSLLLLFRPRIADGGGPDPEPTPEQGQVPAGRSKRQRKYIVEIDGQEFVVESVSEALRLLDTAQALARKQAKERIESTVAKGLPKATRLGKVEAVQPQKITITGSLPLYKEIQAAKDRIERIYRDAALTAELRLLMALDAERDDEEAILLSL